MERIVKRHFRRDAVTGPGIAVSSKVVCPEKQEKGGVLPSNGGKLKGKFKIPQYGGEGQIWGLRPACKIHGQSGKRRRDNRSPH